MVAAGNNQAVPMFILSFIFPLNFLFDKPIDKLPLSLSLSLSLSIYLSGLFGLYLFPADLHMDFGAVSEVSLRR